MALWPFNRRKRKDSRAAETDADAPNLGISTRITAQDPKQVRRDTKTNPKARSRQASRAHEDASAIAAVTANGQRELPSTDGPLQNGGQTDSNESRTPLAEVRNPVADKHIPGPLELDEKDRSHISLQKAATEPITPTLQNKRSRGPQDGSRAKSTKRRAEEKDRLQEIKTMSAPIPVPKRPRSIAHGFSPLAQDSRKIRDGMNRNLERPMSEISLPLADSLRSSLSGNLEMSSSYRVSAFDALSPRPRILYSDGARHASDTFIASRTSTKKDKGPAIPEEDFQPRARIDKLADEMDATDLREMMERDRRRRERKKQRDRDKLERRLQFKADKQKERAQRKAAAAAEAASTAVDDSGDVQMHDVDEPGPSKRRSPLPEPVASPSSLLNDPSRASPEPAKPLEIEAAAERAENEEKEVVVEPQSEARPATPPAPPAAAEPPTELPASDSRSNLALITPVTTPQRTIVTPQTKESPASKARDTRQDSEGPSRWKTIFRRSGTRQRGSSDKSRGTPSEFSNTSRESFARQQKEKAATGAAVATSLPPPPPPAILREPKGRSASNTPRRTKSKFREDLPEFVSPPASHHSRVNSAESPISPISPRVGSGIYDVPHSKEHRAGDDVETVARESGGLSRNQSQRSGSPEGQSATLLSQSLASVDSEGSWLSGRPAKRSSLPLSKREGSDSISEQVGESTTNASREQDATYFARRDPATGVIHGQQSSGITAQLARGLHGPNDGESAQTSTQQSPIDDQPRGGRVAGHQPMLVRSDDAHRSREGLVGVIQTGEGASPRHGAEVTVDRPESAEDEAVSVHEARSVDYNKGHHSRRVSAGSARILEIPGRDKRHSGLSVSAVSATSSRNSPALPSPAITHQTFEEEIPGQARSKDGEVDKRQSAVSVDTAGGTSRIPGLGLGLRLGARIAGRSATPEPEK